MIKVYDRVHVEFDGVVLVKDINDYIDSYLVKSDDGTACTVPASACTSIVPPVKVGDIVTPDNINQFSVGSIVARPRRGCVAVIKDGENSWSATGGNSKYTDKQVCGWGDAQVLRIGTSL